MKNIILFLDTLNRQVNESIQYTPELTAVDNWQAPQKTLETGKGDCEDIAILKMAMLMEIIPRKDLKLIYCKTWQGEPHIILEVKVDEDHLILDNLDSWLTTRDDIDHSDPIYMIDGTGEVTIGTGEPSPARMAKFDRIFKNG